MSTPFATTSRENVPNIIFSTASASESTTSVTIFLFGVRVEGVVLIGENGFKINVVGKSDYA